MKIKKLDFSKQIFRSHAIGTLMTGSIGLTEKQVIELKELSDKRAVKPLTDLQEIKYNDLIKKRDDKELSKTTKTKLIEIYNAERFGRSKELKAKYIKKGLMCEDDARTLLTRLEFQTTKQLLKKNDKRIANRWVSGEYDTFIGESVRKATEIIDHKVKWDLFSFSAVFDEELESNYKWQLLCYMWLSGAKKARVSNALIDTPEQLVNDEKRRLLYEMGAVSDENPDYLEACDEIDREHHFDDIPLAEREFSIYFNRDEAMIEELKQRIPLWRNFLVEYHIKRLNYGLTRKWKSVDEIVEEQNKIA